MYNSIMGDEFMIEIKYEENEKVDNLYNEIKNIILSKKDNQSFKYNFKQHHLYEESKYPGISKNYYNESGAVEFENVDGKIIRLEIERWHPHKHNGCSGLNGNPCLTAVIYEIENEEKKVLWELNVKSGTLYYKAEVSNLEIPNDILQEKYISFNSNIEENVVLEIIENEIELENQSVESQDSRNLFEEIVNLYNKYKCLEQGKDELLLKRKKDIEEATDKIIKYYSQKLIQTDEDITSTKKELNDFDKLFAKYSTFNIDLIGNAIQQLISIVECEEYLYEEVMHKLKKRVHGVMDSWDEDVLSNVNIVVRKDKLVNYYDSCSEFVIDDLIKKGDAILLCRQCINSHNNEIIFYTSKDGQVSCYFDFGKFDYVKEFIDSIVQYRFQNNMIEFTEKDMITLVKEFVNEHKNIIMKNYDSRLKEKTLSLKLDSYNV